jgi:CDP-diacylglycerol---glycerol-3-phosphate 3-phosphatidyltransferase
MTLYALKPKFQALLRPQVERLAARGVTANQVTLLAALVSVLVGALVAGFHRTPVIFLLLPVWLFARMALNAVDGMLAREFGQQSRLGGYLNELCDIVSDAALVVFLAILGEYAGVMGPLVGASRRYDGPLGKSDRALVFGALGFWVGLGLPLGGWAGWLMPLIALLLVWTLVNRVRRGLDEV